MKKGQFVFLILGAITSGLLAYWVSLRIFHQAPITTDEQSYFLQAHIFSTGRMKYEPPPFLDPFLYEMVVVDREKGWFSRYPPGHSAWLAAGVLIGNPYMATAFAASLGYLAVGLSILFLRGEAIGSLLVLLFSPFYLFTNGTLLSHVTGFTASAAMFLFFVLWQKNKRHVYAVLAGFFWALLFLNRTYTALLMAIPVGAYSLWLLWRDYSRRQLNGTILFATAAAAGLPAIMIYNYLMVGDPFQMTYLYYWPTDGLGFGLRHNGFSFPASLGIMHTPQKGISEMLDNIKLLDEWLLGFRGGLILWVVVAIISLRMPFGLMLVSLLPVVALGYSLFWYAGWNQTGPNYYVEVLPAMMLAGSLGLGWIRDRIFKRQAWFYVALLILFTIWLRPLLAFGRDAAASWRDEQARRADIISLIDSVQEPSIVFIKREVVQEAWADNDMAFTPRGVEGTAIVVRWLDASNHAVIKYFEDRTPLLLVQNSGSYELQPLGPLPPFSVEFPIPRLFRDTGTNIYADDSSSYLIRIARLDDLPGYLLYGRHAQLYPGKFEVLFEARASKNNLCTLRMVRRQGADVLAEKNLAGGDDWQSIILNVDSDDYFEIEPQAIFHGGGEVQIRRVNIREVD